MADTQTIHVAFASDTVTAMPMTAAIASLLATRAQTTRLEIHVLSCGMTTTEKDRAFKTVADHGAGAANLHWHDITGANATMLTRFYTDSDRPYPPANYARLLVGEFLPADADRVIYLDIDVVALTDLAPFWNLDMTDVTALSIPDLPHTSGQPERLMGIVSEEDRARFGFDGQRPYFQAGVLMLKLAPFRTGLVDTIADVLRAYPQLTFPDQDALNITLAKEHRLIDPRWNSMTSVYWYKDGEELPYDAEMMRALQEEPFIVHYSGRPKPWEEGSTHPLAHHWQRFFEMTPWVERRRTLLTRAIDRVPRARRVLGKRLRRLLGL